MLSDKMSEEESEYNFDAGRRFRMKRRFVLAQIVLHKRANG
ncbi:hypothetical protein ACO1KE_13570 [Leptospira interrogans serovar Bataviae]|nr:hypothetical protein [Leptospira interrogans]